MNAPKHLLKGGPRLRQRRVLRENCRLAYTGSRYFSYINNAEVDGYTLADFTAGYRFSGNDALEGLELQLNVTNLMDEDYVSTIGTNGFNINSDNQTLMVGSPRQVFATIRKSF